MSFLDFREAFLQDTLDLLWGQWCTLGVAGHSRGAGAFCIDPEALLLATCRFGRYDQRLFDGMLEWLTKYEELLSSSRISSLARNEFGDSVPVIQAVAAFLAAEYKKHRWSKLAGEPLKTSPPETFFLYPNGSPAEIFGHQDALFLSYGFSRGTIERKGHIGPFQMNHPGSLWPRLRALMGVSGRTDVLVYLMLFKNGGHPSLIARELGYTQRGIHQALVSMSSSGWIQRSERPREVVYVLADSIRETFTSSLRNSPRWVTWVKFYGALEIFWRTLNDTRLANLSVDGQSAELRGGMLKAANSLSSLGFSGSFMDSQNKRGEEYAESLAKSWKALFVLLHE
jgi:DNA-binding MarR family transcriptional regulator